MKVVKAAATAASWPICGKFTLPVRCGSVSAKKEISRVNNNKGETALRFNMANLTTISGFGIRFRIGIGIEIELSKKGQRTGRDETNRIEARRWVLLLGLWTSGFRFSGPG